MNDFDQLIHYPFQLRSTVFVHLYLPGQLTRGDVEKITAMLRCLVVPEPEAPYVPEEGSAERAVAARPPYGDLSKL